MERITAKQVRGMFDRVVQAARALGITEYRWDLQEGSPINGRAWRLYTIDIRGGGLRDALGSDGYLGWTNREAYGALHALARGWELLRGSSTVLTREQLLMILETMIDEEAQVRS